MTEKQKAAATLNAKISPKHRTRIEALVRRLDTNMNRFVNQAIVAHMDQIEKPDSSVPATVRIARVTLQIMENPSDDAAIAEAALQK